MSPFPVTSGATQGGTPPAVCMQTHGERANMFPPATLSPVPGLPSVVQMSNVAKKIY